jgi:hypothetical protein
MEVLEQERDRLMQDGSVYLPFLAGSAALVFLVPRNCRRSTSVYHTTMIERIVVPSSRGSSSRVAVYVKACQPWSQGQTN